MRISFILTDDSGKQFAGEALLTPVAVGKRPRRRESGEKAQKPRSVQLSFALNPRAFVKRYGRGLTGPQKFVLLLARLANGDASREVQSDAIEAQWNNMKAVMGGAFYPMYATRAKENGWVDTPKRGVYVLSPTWKEVFERADGQTED